MLRRPDRIWRRSSRAEPILEEPGVRDLAELGGLVSNEDFIKVWAQRNALGSILAKLVTPEDVVRNDGDEEGYHLVLPSRDEPLWVDLTEQEHEVLTIALEAQ